MSELRVLRCTRETYSIVASYAGQNELSLCEALSQIVFNGTLSVRLEQIGATATLNESAAELKNQTQDEDPWKEWREFFGA